MLQADDPPRLLDAPGESLGDLRLGLERLSTSLPNAEELARMAARLGLENAPQADLPRAGASPSVAAKLATLAGVVGIVALGWFLATRRGESARLVALGPPSAAPAPSLAPPFAPGGVSHAESARAPARAASEKTRESDTEPTPPASAPVPSSPSAEPSRDALRPESASVRETPSPDAKQPHVNAPGARHDATPAPGSPPLAARASETELLRDARLVLERDPGQALALSEKHRSEYPNGAFSQEREVIAITALARLGRSAEAKTRADRFRRLYPSSAYTVRIDRVVSPD